MPSATTSTTTSTTAPSATSGRTAAPTPDSLPTPEPGSQRAPYRSGIQGRQTFARSVSAEWTKLWSLRSTWVTSAVTILLTTLIGATMAVALSRIDGYESYAADAITTGTAFGQIVICVQAALVITGEYATGQIRSSLAAVPRRGNLLGAKAAVVTALAFLLGLVSLLVTWSASAPFMNGHAGSLTDLDYLGYFWGAGLGFAGIALMCLGLGFLTRSTAGTITAAVSLLFVADLPLSFAAQRWEWAVRVSALLPSSVSGAVSDPFSHTQTWGQGSIAFLDQWQAVLVFALWALVPMVAAWGVFSRRDA